MAFMDFQSPRDWLRLQAWSVALCLGLVVQGASAADFSDNFGASTPLSGPVTVTGDNLSATAEFGEPAHAFEPAQHSIWAKWTATTTATYTVLVTNNSFDTVLAVYLGNSLAKLRMVSTNDDIDFRTLGSQVIFRAYAGETFNIAIDGVSGAQGTFRMIVGLAGPQMEPWTTVDVFGRQMLSEHFFNKFVMFDFWETTCGGCVDELYELFHVHQTLAPKDFSMVGLAMDADPIAVYNFIIEYPFPYPIYMSSPAAIYNLSHNPGVGAPTKFLVDPERRIVASFASTVSPVSGTYQFYTNSLAPIMRNSSLPQLQVERQSNLLLVSWPDSIFPLGFRLESSSRLAGGAWSSVSGFLYTNSGRVTAVLQPNFADPAPQFFRLNNPNP